jgi:hypothetical protein
VLLEFPVHPRSTQISDNCRQVRVFQEQAAEVTKESEGNLAYIGRAPDFEDLQELAATSDALDDSSSFSGSAKSSTSSDIEDFIEDLKMFNDCFMDLVPILENPAKTSGLEEKPFISREGLDPVTEAARTYITNIIDKFPSIEGSFAQRLGEANWQRHERLREKLSSILQEEIEWEDASSVNDEKMYAGYEAQTAHFPIQSETTKSSYSGPSLWDRKSNQDSNFGRIESTYAVLIPNVPPSMTSFASSIGDADTNKIRRHIPKLPDNHNWGSPFRCSVCGDMTQNVKNYAEWKYVSSMIHDTSVVLMAEQKACIWRPSTLHLLVFDLQQRNKHFYFATRVD